MILAIPGHNLPLHFRQRRSESPPKVLILLDPGLRISGDTVEDELRRLAKIAYPSHIASISYSRLYSATARLKRRFVRRMFLDDHRIKRTISYDCAIQTHIFVGMEPLNVGSLYSPPSLLRGRGGCRPSNPCISSCWSRLDSGVPADSSVFDASVRCEFASRERLAIGTAQRLSTSTVSAIALPRIRIGLNRARCDPAFG